MKSWALLLPSAAAAGLKLGEGVDGGEGTHIGGHVCFCRLVVGFEVLKFSINSRKSPIQMMQKIENQIANVPYPSSMGFCFFGLILPRFESNVVTDLFCRPLLSLKFY